MLPRSRSWLSRASPLPLWQLTSRSTALSALCGVSYCAAVCICRFVPDTCPDFLPVFLNTDTNKFSVGQSKKACCTPFPSFVSLHSHWQGWRLSLAWWLAAWERYSLAAVVTGQMPFAVAVGHKTVVLGVAAQASTKGRCTLLGVLYDELVRRVSLHFLFIVLHASPRSLQGALVRFGR